MTKGHMVDKSTQPCDRWHINLSTIDLWSWDKSIFPVADRISTNRVKSHSNKAVYELLSSLIIRVLEEYPHQGCGSSCLLFQSRGPNAIDEAADPQQTHSTPSKKKKKTSSCLTAE